MAEVKRPTLVASNVLVKDGKVLLGLRANCGLWEFPGGKVDEESVLDAARREMREESGVDLLGEPIFVGYSDGWHWSGQAGKRWYVCLGFLWNEFVGEPRRLEPETCREWRWFDLADVPSPEFCTFGTKQLMLPVLGFFTQFARAEEFRPYRYPIGKDAMATLMVTNPLTNVKPW